MEKHDSTKSCKVHSENLNIHTNIDAYLPWGKQRLRNFTCSGSYKPVSLQTRSSTFLCLLVWWGYFWPRLILVCQNSDHHKSATGAPSQRLITPSYTCFIILRTSKRLISKSPLNKNYWTDHHKNVYACCSGYRKGRGLPFILKKCAVPEL